MKSMGAGFVVNSLMMVMVVLGLDDSLHESGCGRTEACRLCFMVQNGVGASFMTPLISILIILGAVSTAVNMVAAMVKRVCGEETPALAERYVSVGKSRLHVRKRRSPPRLICCLAGFRNRPVRPAAR